MALISAAHANPVANFYNGKTLNIVVGHQAGTGFDVYSRVLARHFSRHIPGKPNVVVQNMNGASGVVSANWLTRVAPKDGTTLGTFVQTVPLEPLFGNDKARYKSEDFTWIGNMESSVALCGVTRASGVTSFDQLREKEAIFGATGPTGPLLKSALAVKNVLGAKMKVVPGYKGSAAVKLAMNRGEVAGICGLPWSTVKSFWRDELKNGEFKPIIQLSGDKRKDLGNIPHYRDFIKTDEDRALFGLVFGVQALGRVYAVPTGTPKERVQALRTAFMETMRDPKFLQDAQKTGIDIEPMTGEQVARMWAEFGATPPAVVKRALEVTTPQK
ncbi:MAG: Bug family tripartite tricarboxylate transporter substrate binding protein [Beijerinckiaceae bacterium]